MVNAWCRLYTCILIICFLFKQKTSYEMRISDWSSDVFSSDLDECGAETISLYRFAVTLPPGAPMPPGASCPRPQTSRPIRIRCTSSEESFGADGTLDVHPRLSVTAVGELADDRGRRIDPPRHRGHGRRGGHRRRWHGGGRMTGRDIHQPVP